MRKTEKSIGATTYVVNNALRNAMCSKMYEEMYFTQIPDIHIYFRIDRAIRRELHNKIT